MKKMTTVTLLLIASFLLVQCNQTQDGARQQHMMSEVQLGQMMDNPEQRQAIMSQMMQNPEQRQAMMSQMAENPEMRTEFMTRMQSSMMSTNHDQMLDRMEDEDARRQSR